MVVLGLDAAWTPHRESGISVVVGGPGSWKCVAAVANLKQLETQAGCTGLLPSAEAIAGAPVTLASVDMPLSTLPITVRRVCDNQLSSAFGAQGCGVHSPTADRPGEVSAQLMRDLSSAGFTLGVHGSRPGERQVIEVYPHIAVMRLLGEPYRVPYKIGRARQYWPDASPAERRARIRRNLGRIVRALQKHISGVHLRLPPEPVGPTALKRFEDTVDGLVCAWIGTRYLEGECLSYGDETAAIWVPK
jgi:predicted RNase H-like nuclease